MPRTVLIGDVHGCARELEDLLGKIGVTSADRVVCVGDLVVRGPAPLEVLDLLYAVNARSVRGNHEDRLLRDRHGRSEGVRLHPITQRTANALRKQDWDWISMLPLRIDLKEHGITVVHAGVVPGKPVNRQEPKDMLYMRTLTPDGQAHRGDGPRRWAPFYNGPPHIVFGHNARAGLQLEPWATGLDSGCVYGRELTAMVLEADQPVPPPQERRDVLVSVPAHAAYFGENAPYDNEDRDYV